MNRTAKQPTAPQTGKHIAFDRVSRDFAAFLDGALIGFFPTYRAAEERLDAVAYTRLTKQAA